jgi:hypothetical protein
MDISRERVCPLDGSLASRSGMFRPALRATILALLLALPIACGSSDEQDSAPEQGLTTPATVGTEATTTQPAAVEQTSPVTPGSEPGADDPGADEISQNAASVLVFDQPSGYSFELSIDDVSIEENVTDAYIGSKYLLVDIAYTLTNTTPGKTLQIGAPEVFVGVPRSLGELGAATSGLNRVGRAEFDDAYSFVQSHYITGFEGQGTAVPTDARTDGGTQNYVTAPEELDTSNLVFLVVTRGQNNNSARCFTADGRAVPTDIPCNPSNAAQPEQASTLQALQPNEVYELLEPGQGTTPPGPSSSTICGDTILPPSSSFFGAGVLAVIYGTNVEAQAGLDGLTEIVRNAGVTSQACSDSAGATWQIVAPATVSTAPNGRTALSYTIVNPDGTQFNIAEENEVCRNVLLSGSTEQVDAAVRLLGC